MFNKGMERIRESEAVAKIEKLLCAEEYGVDNPIIDIKKISNNIFNFECIDCEYLIPIKQNSLVIKGKKLILLNPSISLQNKKIEIARQLVNNFYTNNPSSINRLTLAFLLPEYIYLSLKRKDLSDDKILEYTGFAENEFLEKEMKCYKHSTIVKKIKNIINENLKNFFIA